MSVSMEKFVHTNQIPAKSWINLEGNNDDKKTSILNRMHDLVVHKAKLIAMITSLGVFTVLSSCGGGKSVDDQVRDIIKEKQEKVDDLRDEKRDLEDELREVNLELKKAEDELRQAEKLRK